MAIVASAKNNVLKTIVPTVKKCLLPSSRPGDSATFVMYRGLSTEVVKYRPEDDSSIQDDRERCQAPEIRRGSWPNILEDSFFFSLRSLGFGLDQLFDNPFLAVSRGTGYVIRGGPRKPWEAGEDKEALYLRVDMPGLGKEEIKVYAEENALVIKGESLSEAELDGSKQKYSSRIELPPKVHTLDQIKAQMKNGVLKVIVPKFTEEKSLEMRKQFQRHNLGHSLLE